jgi:Flagellar motor switch/type III secretory pathway protein
MSTFLNCWFRVAGELFRQALAGEPELVESKSEPLPAELFGWRATLSGDETGEFAVQFDTSTLQAPLLGEGMEQRAAWEELVRETFEAACGELLARHGMKCRVDKVETATNEGSSSHCFELRSGERSWRVWVRDASSPKAEYSRLQEEKSVAKASPSAITPGLELLLDIELEASLRFGCREMPLGEILELGPGDVVQLDRHIADPVDLIVGDKIVARGEVVLVNGNFGLRVSEVAAPQRRLESIRCLF